MTVSAYMKNLRDMYRKKVKYKFTDLVSEGFVITPLRTVIINISDIVFDISDVPLQRYDNIIALISA